MEDVEPESSALASADEDEPESSPDVEVEPSEVDVESLDVGAEPPVVDPEGAALVAVFAPIEPSMAIAPNATANVARATAATRRRRRAIRCARALSFSRARSAGEGECCADMGGTVGALPRNPLGAGWEIPERGSR